MIAKKPFSLSARSHASWSYSTEVTLPPPVHSLRYALSDFPMAGCLPWASAARAFAIASVTLLTGATDYALALVPEK